MVSLPRVKFFLFAEQMSSRSLRKLQEKKDDIQDDPEESGEDVGARGKSSFNAFLLVRSDLTEFDAKVDDFFYFS